MTVRRSGDGPSDRVRLGRGPTDGAGDTARTTRSVAVPDRFERTAFDPFSLPPLRPPNSTAFPKLVGLIAHAKQRLYLHLRDVHDPDVFAHLLDAQRRGAQVHLVVSNRGPLDPVQVQRLQALTEAGVDLLVKRSSPLKARSGVADGAAFSTSTARGLVAASSLEVSRHPARVARDVAAFERALTPAVAGPLDRGLLPRNRVLIHNMPEAGAAPIINAINAAKETIDLEVYQLSDRRVIEALKKAATERHVKVRVMVEPKTVEASNYPWLKAQLEQAGIQIQPTPPRFDSKHNVDHAKFMLIDGKELLFGTGNLVPSGLGGHELPETNNRDFWVEDTRRASLADARKLFDADWNRQPTSSSDFTNLVVTPDNADDKLLSLIGAARRRLYVYNQSLSDPKTIAALLKAKADGVEVKVLLGVQQDHPGVPPKNQPAVDALRAAGIDVQYLTKNYLHAKAIVSDDDVFIGSQNFTSGGLHNNREVGEIFSTRTLVRSVVSTFQADFADPGPQPVITPPSPHPPLPRSITAPPIA